MNRKVFSILISMIALVIMLPFRAIADTDALLTIEELRKEKGAITIEVYNIGQGFLLEPSLYDKEGKSTGDLGADVGGYYAANGK